MPASPTRYVTAPDDLPARVVGTWVADKVFYVDRYTDMFATAMRPHFPRRAYIELFAGPGMSQDRHRRSFVTGSAIRALSAPFTDYVLVDIDQMATAALDQRIETSGARATKQATVIRGDCNEAVPQIRSLLPSSGTISLAFVDPTTWQVTFDAITQLVAGRRVDLLFTFHVATMRRMVKHDPPALTAFFGTSAWRDALKLPRAHRTEGLLRLYNEQLVSLGYRPDSYDLAVPIRNTVGRPIYYLILFSKDKLGVKFWRDVKQSPLSGQLQLPL